MVSSTDPAHAVALATLLRGRNSVVRPFEEYESAVQGASQPDFGTGSNSAGDSSTLAWTLCRSASELAQALQRGSSLSVGLGLLPLVETKLAFFESLKTTIFSVSLVVHARKVTHALEIPQASLREGVVLPSTAAELDTFVALHGDSFVSAVRVGGECQGVYTFYAQSREQAREVETAFGGGVTLGGLSVGPQLSTKIQEVSRSTGVNISFNHAVSGLSSHPPLGPENLIAFASEFASMELDQPQILALETRGYERVPDLATVFRPVVANRSLFTGDGIQEGLLRKRQRLRELLNQIDWVAGTYAVYGIPEDQNLRHNRRLVLDDIREIEILMSQYLASPSTALAAPALTALDVGSPQLNVQLSDGELMGGNGGKPFTYPDYPERATAPAYPERATAVQTRTRLEKVGLRAQNRIDQIRLTYRCEPGALAEPATWDEVHGKTGGSDLGDMQLGSGVGINRIEAVTGTRVDRLRLVSSDGQSLSGGGNAGNRPYNWSLPVNSVLLGFSGRAATELDALRAVIAEFAPLSWEPLDETEDP